MIIQLQEDRKVRAPQMRDIPAIADLVNSVALAADGVLAVDPLRMRLEWQQPDWDHTTDGLDRADRHGAVCGLWRGAGPAAV
ncbi:hypothetical protein ACFLYO_04990 [Chloroflexota bacterium]